MASDQKTKQEFNINEVLITSDRLGSQEFDVTSLVAELNFYEDIDKPYLTGTLAMLDDLGLFSNAIGFKGTDRVTITVSSSIEESNLYTFTRTFIMTEIVVSKKVSDKAEVYVISLIDEHAFIDATKKISKSYVGKFEDISAAIIISELELDIDFSFLTPSAQKPVKVIVPYLSPLQASKWLMSRATTDNGSPYWVYATLYDNNIRISSFDALYTQPPFNAELPFIFSTALTNAVQDLGPEYQNMLVKEVNADGRENTMKLVNKGAIGSTLSSTDVFSNRTIKSKHKVGKTLQRLKQNEIIPSNSQQTVYDSDQVVIEDANNSLGLDDLSSRILHTITSKGTYCSFNNYHDATNKAEVGDKQRNASIRNLLLKNPIDVTVSGLALFLGKIGAGDMVRINFLNSDVGTDGNANDRVLDIDKSGDYMILQIRHTFKETIHDATMTVTKINRIQSGNII